jgi:aspartyl-tRNA(Asn)/glutamyl-tRNA(Gln) amidotransferase subunit B
MDYEAVIGLEVHCQLTTQTKLFGGAPTGFGRPPNTQTDPVSLGLPGALPVLNGAAVDRAIAAAIAVGGDIQARSIFDRKHYFYPDLPKGYQISQYQQPYCVGGGVPIVLADGSGRTIPLTRIHMEEDAGKLVHGAHGSEVDLNRAGTPLIEIVSDPALRTPAEAYAYLVELRRRLVWVEASACEMQEGSLRCDANVSVRPVGQHTFGTRVEIKNLNSFRAVEAAIAHEIAQQTALCKAGRGAEIIQCTKLWDPDTATTRIMRTKESAADYRYFPDPDLPPLEIAPDRVARIRARLPELPQDREARFVSAFALEPAVARAITGDRPTADYVEALIGLGAPPRLAANWTREEALRLANESGAPLAEAAPLATMAALIALVDSGQVARVEAKAASADLFACGEDPKAYFTSRGKIQVQDAGATNAWAAAIIAAEPRAADDVRAGRMQAIGRLIGGAMKLAGGKGDPNALRAAILAQLGR